MTLSLALAALVLPALLQDPADQAPTADPTVPELYRPGDESRWVFEVDGERIGDHRFRYAGTEELGGELLHRFEGWTRLVTPTQLGELEQRIQGELWVDDVGLDRRQVLEVEVQGTYTRIELVRADDRVEFEMSGARSMERTTPISPAAFVQANNFIGYFELFYRLKRPSPEGTNEYRLFSANVLQEFPYRVTWKDRFERTVDGETVSGDLWSDSLGEDVAIADDGRLVALEVAAQKLVVRRTGEELPRFSVEPPSAREAAEGTESEEVVIEHGEVSIAGSVVKPAAPEGTRFPAVFFISGSGPQDRDGRGGGIDLGTHELLDRLVSEGFLTLRVDDRGTGGTSSPERSVGYLELVADARACVEFLFAREDVDPERVVLVGHSEGGVTAPILAAEDPRIAAIVLMAASGRPVPELIIEQNEQLLAKSGLPPEEQARALDEVKRFMAAVRAGEELVPEDWSPEFAGLIQNLEWLAQHAATDPPATLAEVECPVLILQGEADLQVSAERDAPVLAAALEAAGHPDFELVLFPRLDHLFKPMLGDEPDLADYSADRRVDAEFLDVLCAWLDARVGDGAGPVK